MTDKIKTPFMTDEEIKKMQDNFQERKKAIFITRMNELNQRFPNEIKHIYSQGWNDGVKKVSEELEKNFKKEVEEVKQKSWKNFKKVGLFVLSYTIATILLNILF